MSTDLQLTPTNAAPENDAPEPADSPATHGRRVAQTVTRSSVFWILLVLVIEIVTFAIILPSGTFLSTFNAQTIAADASVLLILAAGATIVIISGGLDLSIGSVMALASVVAALVMKDVSGSQPTAIMAGIGAGMAVAIVWGCVNGLLVAVMKVPPFIVTLGSL